MAVTMVHLPASLFSPTATVELISMYDALNHNNSLPNLTLLDLTLTRTLTLLTLTLTLTLTLKCDVDDSIVPVT